MLARIPWQVYAITALAGLIALLTVSRSHWIDRAHGDEAQLSAICTTTRTASGNSKLDCKATATQIGLMGQAIDTYRTALGSQNAKVKALGEQSASEQKIAAEAEKQAKESADEAEAVRDQLLRAARSAAARRAPGDHCEPLPQVKGQWQ